MAVESIPHKTGAGRAKIVCDECGRSDVVPCAYVGNANASSDARRPNESQARAKAINMGWAYVKGRLRCQSCETKRKIWTPAEKKDQQMTKTAPARTPDGKQKRLIILALEDVYDDKAKRYKGDATDKTIAADLGGGVMPGWVAEIRDDMFGPAGNEEADKLRADIEALRVDVQKKVDELTSRLDRVVAAHDKRVKA